MVHISQGFIAVAVGELEPEFEVNGKTRFKQRLKILVAEIIVDSDPYNHIYMHVYMGNSSLATEPPRKSPWNSSLTCPNKNPGLGVHMNFRPSCTCSNVRKVTPPKFNSENKPLKNGGKGIRSGFLLGAGNFSGANC